MFKNTGIVCTLTLNDENRKDGLRHVDMGNFYETEGGERVLITSSELAQTYGHLVQEKIYLSKDARE